MASPTFANPSGLLSPGESVFELILSHRVANPWRVHLYIQTDRQQLDIYILTAREFITVRVGGVRRRAIRGFNTGRMRENQSPIEPEPILSAGS